MRKTETGIIPTSKKIWRRIWRNIKYRFPILTKPFIKTKLIQLIVGFFVVHIFLTIVAIDNAYYYSDSLESKTITHTEIMLLLETKNFDEWET